MQRTWADRLKRIILIALPFLVIALSILVDQLAKVYFKDLYLDKGGRTEVIRNFFYFTYTVNTGAAWSFLSDVSWAQTFFKILTSVAIVGFSAFMVYAYKKKFKWLQYSLALILGGTIGNFIDRLLFNGVIDFISFVFGDYYFPVFNIADSCLVIGVIMMSIHFLFLDDTAVFKKKPEDEQVKEESNDVVGENGREDISDN